MFHNLTKFVAISAGRNNASSPLNQSVKKGKEEKAQLFYLLCRRTFSLSEKRGNAKPNTLEERKQGKSLSLGERLPLGKGERQVRIR